MDVLVILGIVVWMIARLSGSAAKRRNAGQARPDAGAGSESASRAAKPIRPMDVDLHGQTTMPIHWNGTVDAAREEPPSQEGLPSMEGRSIPSSMAYEEMKPMLGETLSSRLTDSSERTDGPEAARVQGGRSKPVSIPGLNLTIDGDTLVQGVIFSEILQRKTARRPR